jgi:hypothetical protein
VPARGPRSTAVGAIAIMLAALAAARTLASDNRSDTKPLAPTTVNRRGMDCSD